MTNGHCWLSRENTDPHQCQADPRQPVLACLTVSVKECSYTLKDGHRGLLYDMQIEH